MSHPIRRRRIAGRRGALAAAVLLAAACGSSSRAASPSSTSGSGATSAPGGLATSPTDVSTSAAPGSSGSVPVSPSVPAAAWHSPDVDGAIYARPIVVGRVVVIATEKNSLYGLDLADGHIVWGPTHVGQPVTRSVLARHGVHCGNIDPLGITGAPAYDAASATVFAVAEVVDPTTQVVSHQIIGVDPASGAVKQAPRAIDPPGTDPAFQLQRPALLAANGYVYVAFGGLYGDCGTYHGWLVGVPTSGAGTNREFEVAVASATNHGGAIWGTSGPVVDSKGTVYVATGNSFDPPPEPGYDRSDGVIALSATLQEKGWFAPRTWRDDNASDQDLGSTGPVLLPGGFVFQVGKSGHGYLVGTIRTGNPLGGIGGEVAAVDVCSTSGANAFADPFVFVACSDGGLRAVRVDTSSNPPSLRVAWHAAVGAIGPPTVAHGTVWSVSPGERTLFGLDAASGAVKVRVKLPGALTRFTTPTVAGGVVLVANGSAVTSTVIASS